MFVDTSVLVAIVADEPDASGFVAKLAEAPHRYTSGPVILETGVRPSRGTENRRIDVSELDLI